jgi:hypothetical protein
MGFSWSKSVGVGPFRVNLSRSGVGFSVGGKGFRTGVNAKGRRYSTASIPGTGIRYTTGGGSKSKKGCLVFLGAALFMGGGAGWLVTRIV